MIQNPVNSSSLVSQDHETSSAGAAEGFVEHMFQNANSALSNISRNNGFMAKIVGVAVAVGLLGAEVAEAQSSVGAVSWEEDTRSRREKRESSVAQIRHIQAPKELTQNGSPGFGEAFKIVRPSAEMARHFNLDSDYQSGLYAWVGCIYANIKKAGDFNGAIVLMDLNTGKDYATIYSPEGLERHFFGFGLKLSPDGKYLGIESGGGPAAILDQETGDIRVLNHPQFGNKKVVREPGKGYVPVADDREIGGLTGCRLEFLPGNKVMVSGVFGAYNKERGTVAIVKKVTFNFFKTDGTHIKSLSDADLYESNGHYFRALSSMCGDPCLRWTGPNLLFNESNNVVYYFSERMLDPYLSEAVREKKVAPPISDWSGRVGAFNLDTYEELPITIHPEAFSAGFKAPITRSAEIYAQVGYNIVIETEGWNEKYKPESAGKLTIFSIAQAIPTKLGEIEVGASIRESVKVTAISAFDDNKFIIAYQTQLVDRGSRSESKFRDCFLGICDLKTMSFTKVEGFKLEDAGLLGITEVTPNPNNKTGLLIGAPGYDRITEVDLVEEYYYQHLYTNHGSE